MLFPVASRRLATTLASHYARTVTMGKGMARSMENVRPTEQVSGSLWGRFHASKRGYISQVELTYEMRYAEKLQKIAEKKGISVEELKKRTKEKLVNEKKAKLSPVTRVASAPSKTQTKDAAEKVIQRAQMPYDSSAPNLDNIVKMELLKNENVETITKIWNEHHSIKDCISAVIPSKVYDTLYKRSQMYPMFILPLPRESGIEFFLLQFNFHQCNFTSLLEYKTKGSEARPFLTINHFPELSDSKGIVLMKGEISDNPRMIDTSNAHFLAFALQQFYATGGERKMNLLEKFHKAPQEFDYQALVKEIESLV
ncbi:ATP11 protein-domain-containing protein [Spinellus fusiger]|nr:ATP11 protein-domain-containing protein [Spinellus fusiger]